MIFAELQYEQDYFDAHFELVEYMKINFLEVQSGLQSDSWIWIFGGNEKVAIDTFSSCKHQIKPENRESRLAQRVIALLSNRYQINIFDRPKLEPHEKS